MIVTILLCLILGIVLGIVALNQSGAKHSHFFKDREIALIMAKAGIADALYQLNYADYSTGNYPDHPVTPNPWFSKSSPFGAGYAGSYSVDFTDSATTNKDKITCTGTYGEKTRTISVEIRGSNAGGSTLNSTGHGIAEAFNKHVIYTNTIEIDGTAAAPTAVVSGNITYVTNNAGATANVLSDLSSTNNTRTQVVAADFGVPVPDWTAYSPSITDPAPACTYSDLGADGPVDCTVGPAADHPTGTYTLLSDDYAFNANLAAHTVNGQVTLNGAITIADLKTGSVAGNNLVINGTVTGTVSGTIYVPSGAISCGAGGALLQNGDIYASGDISLTNPGVGIADDITYTDIVSGGSITISKGNANSLTITGNIYAGGTVTLSGAIVSGTVVGNDVDITSASICAITPSSNNAAILCVNDISLDNAAHDINGLVYASGDIDINNADIDGVVVCNGTLQLDDNADIAYSSSAAFETTNIPVYADTVTGGRRIYLPVIDSWREE